MKISKVSFKAEIYFKILLTKMPVYKSSLIQCNATTPKFIKTCYIVRNAFVIRIALAKYACCDENRFLKLSYLN